MADITSVIKRSGAVVPFNPERITNAIYRAAVAVGGRDRAIAEALTVQVISLLQANHPPGYMPNIEEIQDAVEKVLIENGHASVAKAYILYRDERSRLRQGKASQGGRLSESIPWKKIWYALDWAIDHGVHTISGLNRRIAAGELGEVITASEAAYHGDIDQAVDAIAAWRQQLKLILISGPSSSGKTTTTIKLSQRLARMGMKLVTLNVDRYFFDLEEHPKDEFGDYDFETPQALDLDLIDEHLRRLVAGERVMIPNYDFKTGQRELNHTPMQVAEDEVILIDSLHGLYPDMTRSVPDEQKFKVYLEPLLQMKDETGNFIRWTDIRLMRRMLRDASFRAYDPTKTLEHWHYVRSSEMRHIIPHVMECDAIINSAMPYELSLYKPALFPQFSSWVDIYRDDPLRQDAFERALRCHHVLSRIVATPDQAVVPVDSVLREFIGGSVYNY
ncbi:MAG: response regulator SirA [Anaerolineae bacterium]|jgi:uridine kinase|nr:response regulator SirA [Anaerolineae bacterium]